MKIDFEAIMASFMKWKIVWIIVGLFLVLLLISQLFTSCGDWYFKRGIKKDRQVIANHLQNAANIQKEIANLESQRSAEIEGAKMEANRLADDREITNQQRANTDRQIDKMNEAINANRGNVNAADIDRLLEQLDR